MSYSLQGLRSDIKNQINFSLKIEEDKGNSKLNQRIASLKLTGKISQSVLDKFLGFFGKRTTVQIDLKNSSKPIYVKIDHLVKELKISKNELKKVANDSVKATQLVIDKLKDKEDAKLKQTREKLKKLKASEADRKIDQESAFFTDQFPDIKTKISDSKFIHLCADRMGYDSMVKLMKEQRTPEKQQVMINTMISIGKTIGESHKVLQDGQKVDPDNVYVKRLKPQSSQNETYAFAITDKHVYVCLTKNKKDGLLGKGGYKIATRAFKIANKGNNEIGEIEKVVRLKAHSDDSEQIKATNEDMDNENELSRQFSENGRATQPFIAKILSKNRAGEAKSIAFQKSYEQSEWIFNDHTRPVSSKVIPLIDIGRGLAQMHAKGWVHIDVKRENVLIDEGHAILADFGMTKQKGQRLKGGSAFTLPPESLVWNNNSHQSFPNLNSAADPTLDSFSYGMMLLEAIEIDESEDMLYTLREMGLGPYYAKLKANEYSDQDISQLMDQLFFPRLISYIKSNYEGKKQQITDSNAFSNQEKQKRLAELQKKQDFEITLAYTAWDLTSLKPEKRPTCEKAVETLEKEFQKKGFKVS